MKFVDYLQIFPLFFCKLSILPKNTDLQTDSDKFSFTEKSYSIEYQSIEVWQLDVTTPRESNIRNDFFLADVYAVLNTISLLFLIQNHPFETLKKASKKPLFLAFFFNLLPFFSLFFLGRCGGWAFFNLF